MLGGRRLGASLGLTRHQVEDFASDRQAEPRHDVCERCRGLFAQSSEPGEAPTAVCLYLAASGGAFVISGAAAAIGGDGRKSPQQFDAKYG